MNYLIISLQLNKIIYLMTSIPEVNNAVHHQMQSCSIILTDQVDENSDFIYQSTFWIHQFPAFVFTKLFMQTENSLIWTGSKKECPGLLALKISQRFQSQSSKKYHQKSQNQFVASFQLKGMAKIKQVHQSQHYRLMVMEFYQYNLEQVCKRLINNKIRYTKDHFQFVIYIFKVILGIVEELHNSGYVHRDLKPENFLVDHSYNIVISDFQLVCKELEVDTSLCGTLQYMAPQRLSQIRRKSPIASHNDVWALGIILFQLLTGETPYTGSNQAEIFEQICSGHIRNQQIPNQAMELIIGILNPNTSKRLKINDIKNHSFLQKDLNRQALKLMQIKEI